MSGIRLGQVRAEPFLSGANYLMRQASDNRAVRTQLKLRRR